MNCRAYTQEEAKTQFLNQIRSLVNYWAKVDEFNVEDKLSGLAFSILNIFDGTTLPLPSMDIVLRPHKDDKKYCCINNQNWWPDGLVINDGNLHDDFYLKQKLKMNFRLFSTKYNLYTNSLFWPSNQRTTSEFVLRPDGKILEIINFDNGYDEIKEHDSRNYIVEPWTGYFDSKGKKIYRGDLLEFPILGLKNEVKWSEGSFVLTDLTEEHCDLPISHGKYFSIVGNIHDVEYTD